MFEPQLGKNIKIYVDDMVVKSKVVSEHLEDLGGTFNVLRRHKLRLNASKCSFGVGQANFWVTWLLTGGLKSTPTRSKPLMT